MPSDAEINPLTQAEAVSSSDHPSPAYRDRLNRWAIARIDSNQTLEVVTRFRSHSDAEGYLKFLQRKTPGDRLIVIFDKQDL